MKYLRHVTFVLLVFSAACGGEEFTTVDSLTSGGASGSSGTGGSLSGGEGGESGSHTQKDGGPGGTGATGGEGGSTGGVGGSETGGAGSDGGTGSVGGTDITGGTGSVGGSGSTGGNGGSGSAGTGSTGGSGGTTCVEYTYEEKIQVCQGNCGSAKNRCDAGSINCTLIDPANNCDLNHQWCDIKSNGSGTCIGCVRDTSVAKNVCSMGENKPFEYVCPAQFRNSIQDMDEVDVDCGGPRSVAKCQTGDNCNSNDDCASQACVNHKCANSSLPQIGCDYYASQGVWCCAESEDECKRVPTLDVAICNGNAYAMQCPSGTGLADQGCSTNNGYWCCPQEIR